MTGESNPDKEKRPPRKPKPPAHPIEYDWRDPSKPRNPEDDLIVEGWRRCADGTFEKIAEPEENSIDKTEDGQ